MRQIPEKIDSKFRFVLLASKRAEQIMRGAQPRASNTDDKATRVAMDEIFQDEVGWEYGPEAVEEDLAEGAEELTEGDTEAQVL